MTRLIVSVLNRFTRTCRQCHLPYGHATGHRVRPTLREWFTASALQGRHGDEQ